MPLNEYICKECGYSYEKLSREPTLQCSQCGGVTEKQIPKIGCFVLNGSGWAKDAYNK